MCKGTNNLISILHERTNLNCRSNGRIDLTVKKQENLIIFSMVANQILKELSTLVLKCFITSHPHLQLLFSFI